MIKAIIIDDEDKARANLETLINEFCDGVEIVAMEGDVESAFQAIQQHQPDLLFLDIEMGDKTGFDLLEQIKENPLDVIFITAYDQYAMQAFKYSTVDYLLKPIIVEDLQAAIGRLNNKKEKGDNSNKFDVLLQNLRSDDNQKLILPTLESLIFVHLNEIIRCESSDNYTYFHLKDKSKILVSKTIKHYEELLPDKKFFRIHQSHLINLDHIKKFVKSDGGYVVMSDDSRVMVSRRKKEEFLKSVAFV
jgi:two-component system LytT family response regulator